MVVVKGALSFYNIKMTLKKRIFLRISHDSQLEWAPYDCRQEYEEEQAQSLEWSIKNFALICALAWSLAVFSDLASGIAGYTLHVRIYLLIFWLVLFLASSHKCFKKRTNNFKKLVIFASCLQFCVIQGLIDRYTQTNSIPFVVLASAVATIATRANGWQVTIYFLLSNGAYLALSQYFTKISSQVDVDFLQFSLVCHVFFLAVPCLYLYDRVKGSVELHKKEFAIKMLQKLT